MTRKSNAAPPSKAQQQHANKVTHRATSGKFKPPPHKSTPKPAELDQDSGGGYNSDRSEIQQ